MNVRYGLNLTVDCAADRIQADHAKAVVDGRFRAGTVFNVTGRDDEGVAKSARNIRPHTAPTVTSGLVCEPRVYGTGFHVNRFDLAVLDWIVAVAPIPT